MLGTGCSCSESDGNALLHPKILGDPTAGRAGDVGLEPRWCEESLRTHPALWSPVPPVFTQREFASGEMVW